MHGYWYNGTIRVKSPGIGLDENTSFCMRRGHLTINTHIVGFTSSFLWIGEDLSYTERIQWNNKMLKMLISACGDYSINVRKSKSVFDTVYTILRLNSASDFQERTPLPSNTILKWLSFLCTVFFISWRNTFLNNLLTNLSWLILRTWMWSSRAFKTFNRAWFNMFEDWIFRCNSTWKNTNFKIKNLLITTT
jgi:hypothetical protein